MGETQITAFSQLSPSPSCLSIHSDIKLIYIASFKKAIFFFHIYTLNMKMYLSSFFLKFSPLWAHYKEIAKNHMIIFLHISSIIYDSYFFL